MNIDPDFANKLLAGASGSALAAWLAKLAGVSLVLATLAGVAIAWFVGPWVADLFDLHKEQARSAVSFLTGFFGLMVLRKLGDGVMAIDAAALGSALQERIASWFPKKPGG